MLSPVIKVVDPQVDFRPVKYSDRQEKLQISDQTLNTVLKFYAAEAKTRRNPKMRPKLVLNLTRKTS